MFTERLDHFLFDRQACFLADQSKTKVAICGRRAGKTTVVGAELILNAIAAPMSLSVYIALTRKNAKLLMLPELRRINERFRLGMTVNLTDLICEFPNGSKIWLSGAENEAQIDKFRGFHFVYVVLDESASFGPHIDAMVRDVIEPGLIDRNGTQVLIGSPGPICSGYFYDACEDPSLGWSKHHWTVLDNPHIPKAREWLAKKRATMRESTYMREWMGLWVPDLDALVYHYDPALNGFSGNVGDLPRTGAEWEYGLGIDIGYDPDPSALVDVAWNRLDPHLYEIGGEVHVGLTPSQIAERIQEKRRTRNYSKIIADGAGLGKGIIAEWRQRFNIPVHEARQKHLKREHIQLLDSDIRGGWCKFSLASPVWHQMTQVVWDETRATVSDRHPNDLLDAWEYIAMEAKHYAARPVTPTEPAGSVAALEREAKAIEQRLIDRAKEASRQTGRRRRF